MSAHFNIGERAPESLASAGAQRILKTQQHHLSNAGSDSQVLLCRRSALELAPAVIFARKLKVQSRLLGENFLKHTGITAVYSYIKVRKNNSACLVRVIRRKTSVKLKLKNKK